jgi:hypothetical protein
MGESKPWRIAKLLIHHNYSGPTGTNTRVVGIVPRHDPGLME